MVKTYDRVKLHAALDHVLDAKKYAKDSKTDASRYSARPAALKYTTVAQMQAAKEDPDSAYDLYAEGKISEALYEAVCKRGVLKYAKDSSEIDEVEAFDIGFADAKKGRAANPRSDWTPWLKKAYDEGYKSGCR